jgi:thiamine kinase-like enzyme
MSELAAAVERVWPGVSPQFEVLGGGITNHNVKVEVGGDAYVLRVAGRDTDLLGIDRRVELEATRAAASLGIGPEVVAFVEPEGWLVTRFIAGQPIAPERIREPENLARVARALEAVHAAPPVSGAFDSFRVVERYLQTTLERGGEEPEPYAWAHEIAHRIEGTRAGEPRSLCHNDLLNANFIDDGARVRIVDWEYAGMGDRFFDLANFAINHELGEGARRELLEACFDVVHEEQAHALELMRFMSDFREAMWGVVQTVLSSLDFDFARYAREHFERLEQTAAEPAFEAALAEA